MEQKSVFNLAKEFVSLDTKDQNRSSSQRYVTRHLGVSSKARRRLSRDVLDPRRHNWKLMISGDDESYSSSSDESSDDETSWDNSSPAVNSMATAIQSEFIRSLAKSAPKSSEVYRDHSPFRSLSTRPANSKAVMSDDKEPVYMTIDESIYEDPIPAEKEPTRPTLPVKATVPSSELPGNALVVFWGFVQMSAQELRDLDLTRCLKVLSDAGEKRFAMLKIRADLFTIDDCDSGESSDSTDSSDEDDVSKKRKRGSSSCRVGKSDTAEMSRTGERQKLRKSLFSCMKRGAAEPRLVNHNNSIYLGGYDAMRKSRRNHEFEYKRIIFCASGVSAGAPENLLCWIHHVVKDNLTSVEFHAVECDDKQHAKLLARSLSKQIAAKIGW